MSASTKTYTTLRPFVHRGRVLATGDTVTLHPKQAQYLLGTHLEAPKAAQAAAQPTKRKGDQ